MSDELIERVALLPCPFCGATDTQLEQAYTRATEDFAYWSVECIGCGVEIVSNTSQAEADEHWNTRAALDRPAPVDTMNWSEAHDFAERYGIPVSVVPDLVGARPAPVEMFAESAKKSESEHVEVTQADREAADAIIAKSSYRIWPADARANITRGLAEYRLAHSAPKDAEVDRMRTALNQIADLGTCAGGKTPAHKLFQQALSIATGAL